MQILTFSCYKVLTDVRIFSFFFNFFIAPIHIGKIFIAKGKMRLESPPKAALETNSENYRLGADSEFDPRPRKPLKTLIELALFYLECNLKLS
jgi:hypothetical protein